MPIVCALFPPRLNLQHRIIVKAFDGKLLVAPVSLKEGDRILESGAGTGVYFEISQRAVTNHTTIARNMDAATCCPGPFHHPDTRHRYWIPSLPHHLSHKYALLHQLHHVSTRLLDILIYLCSSKAAYGCAHCGHVESCNCGDIPHPHSGSR